MRMLSQTSLSLGLRRSNSAISSSNVTSLGNGGFGIIRQFGGVRCLGKHPPADIRPPPQVASRRNEFGAPFSMSGGTPNQHPPNPPCRSRRNESAARCSGGALCNRKKTSGPLARAGLQRRGGTVALRDPALVHLEPEPQGRRALPHLAVEVEAKRPQQRVVGCEVEEAVLTVVRLRLAHDPGPLLGPLARDLSSLAFLLQQHHLARAVDDLRVVVHAE